MLIALDDVRHTVGLVLGRRDPQPDSRLEEDLGAESLDLLSIMVTLEDKYGISIAETAMAEVRTVRDLHGLALRSPAAAANAGPRGR